MTHGAQYGLVFVLSFFFKALLFMTSKMINCLKDLKNVILLKSGKIYKNQRSKKIKGLCLSKWSLTLKKEGIGGLKTSRFLAEVMQHLAVQMRQKSNNETAVLMKDITALSLLLSAILK